MIAQVNIHSKSFGNKDLYEGLHLNIAEEEKIGLIGRNGSGKSTLLNILSGTDTEYDGEVTISKSTVLVSSRQEHHRFEESSVIDYIANDLPEYSRLKHILDTYPEQMGTDASKIQRYTDALERFSQLGYYDIHEDIEQLFAAYQIDTDKIYTKVGDLSGGQKRLVELVKIQRAAADLALIDEPTNHMDYVAKQSFVEWLESTKDAVVVITHDRDVLKSVDKIIEIRDGKADVFRGNYDAYLKINANNISAELNEYGNIQRRINNLENSVTRFKRLKERARDPGTISQFKMREQRARKELNELQSRDKPSFWIDQESTGNLNTKISAAYDEHKTRNIRIQTTTKLTQSTTKLLQVDDLSLGYDSPLFSEISFELREGDRLQLHGRNGAGKTTLVKSIIATNAEQTLPSQVFAGTIELDSAATIGVYEQELAASALEVTLEQAVEDIHRRRNLPCSHQRVRQLLSDYLFDYESDARLPVRMLSGGQKARLQLIDMLAGDPNILVLDEPTNHLDLPSIEELEFALTQYYGAVIYISHDSYFCEKIGGEVVEIAES